MKGLGVRCRKWGVWNQKMEIRILNAHILFLTSRMIFWDQKTELAREKWDSNEDSRDWSVPSVARHQHSLPIFYLVLEMGRGLWIFAVRQNEDTLRRKERKVNQWLTQIFVGSAVAVRPMPAISWIIAGRTQRTRFMMHQQRQLKVTWKNNPDSRRN